MKVLVTGARGHVGVNLVSHLLQDGHEVRALIHTSDAGLEGLDAIRVRGDLRDSDSLRDAVTDVEAVFHAAAVIDVDKRDPAGMRAVNVGGTKNLLDAAERAGVRRFIHFSTVHAFQQEPRDGVLDETRPQVASTRAHPYDQTKSEAQQMVVARNTPDFETVVLNPTGIIGPHDREPSRMGAALLAIAKREIPGLVKSGFDWVDVRDVCASAVRALEAGRGGEMYLLSGHWRSFKHIAATIEDIYGARPPRLFAPLWLAYASLPFMTFASWFTRRPPSFSAGSLHMLRVQCPAISSAKAAAELGHQARPFEESIRDLLAEFQETGLLAPKASEAPS